MEGYWYTLNCRPVKRRIMIAVQIASPTDMPAIQRFEDPAHFHAEDLIRCGGFIRPVAIRATAVHSFTGDHKFRLDVNVDFDNMNMKFTKELAFKLGGGYHVTHINSLLSIIKKGIVPGGGSGGRDHMFFGEYAPWDPANSCTLAYLGPDVEQLLVMYVPASRLLKYRSIIVRDVVPFHEIQEMWITGKSRSIGLPAVNPRRIMSDKIVDEVVCQCELADRSVPSAMIRIVVDNLIKEATNRGRTDLIHALEKCWEPYVRSHSDGVVAAAMGAQIVLSCYELFPALCARNRMCPTCTTICPKTLLSCPQCKLGRFISSGVVNRSAPVETILTKEEIDKMVREREESLKDTNFPDDEEVERQ